MLAHLVVDLFVSQIDLGTQARRLQLLNDLKRIRIGVRDDRRHHHLQRRQPKREMARVVLDQDAGEALKRAEDGAVDHHRYLLLRMLIDVKCAEPAGHVEVDLRGPALPIAPNGVAQDVLELRSIECALTRSYRGLVASAAALGDFL